MSGAWVHGEPAAGVLPEESERGATQLLGPRVNEVDSTAERRGLAADKKGATGTVVNDQVVPRPASPGRSDDHGRDECPLYHKVICFAVARRAITPGDTVGKVGNVEGEEDGAGRDGRQLPRAGVAPG